MKTPHWLFSELSHLKDDGVFFPIYGVVLYRDSDFFVRAVIDDQSCCDAYAELTGSKWLVLASKKPALSKSDKAYLMRLYEHGTFSDDLDTHKDSDISVIDFLGLNSIEDLPCLLLLMPRSESNAICKVVPIEGNTKDSVFTNLSDSLRLITSVINNINPSNINNPEGIDSALDLALSLERRNDFILSCMPFINWIIRSGLRWHGVR